MADEKYIRLAKLLDNIYNNYVEGKIDSKINLEKFNIKLENNRDFNDFIKYFTDELITESNMDIEALLFVIVSKLVEIETEENQF